MSLKTLKNLYENGYGADVFLMVEGDERKQPAHRFILMAASKYFETLLSAKSEKKILHLQEMAFDTMKVIVKYIYTKDLPRYKLAFEDLSEILCAANLLKVDILEGLQDNLVGVAGTTNILKLYKFKWIWDTNTDITDSVKDFVVTNFGVIRREKAFLDLDHEWLMEFLESPNLDLDEVDVFRTICKWIDHDYANRQQYFAELLKCMRYDEEMSIQFIMDDILKRCICKESKRYLIDLLALRDGLEESDIVNTEERERE